MPARFSPIFAPASPQAAAISGLFLTVLIVCGIIFFFVVALVGVGLIRYRRRPGAEEPPQYFGNRRLEILWTVVPALIVVGLLVLTARGMQRSDPAADREPDLLVIAHQWWWEVRYPQNGVVTANEIHLPVGKKWLVRLQSADVIHDFWVPALARKMDVVPGHPNHIWLQADRPGTYAGICAEYCGAEHAWMRFTVVAQAPEAFTAWLHEQEKPAALPVTEAGRSGLKIFQSMTCTNCHALRGISVAGDAAPDLTHLASRALLGAGVLTNTEADLYRWLKNPQALKPDCFMPNLKLTNAQAQALASYLETLK